MPHTLLLSSEPNRNWSPRHLQAMSYLYGLATPDSDQAKVLELGCGTGANLLPFAIAYPKAQATGIDIDSEQIAAGQLHLDKYGIENINLYTADLATLLESTLEQYDYILIRGLFAQTDLETRTALLRFCRQHLSPTGIICIGYQTYPGSKLTDSLYEAFAFHAAQSENQTEQVAGLKAMLGFMSEGLSNANPLYDQLKPALKALEKKSDEQLYIESLAGLHNPCYFIEFANTLLDADLCYVGDAEAHTEIPEHWGAETTKLCHAINPKKNKIFGQQYLDLLCGRSTRMSLLTHAQYNPLISFEPDTDRLMDLRWAGYFQRVDKDGNYITKAHYTIKNEILHTENTTILDIFDALGYVYPFSLDGNHLYLNTRTETDIIKDDHQFYTKLNESLRTIFIKTADHIYLSVNETPYDRADNECLTTIPSDLITTNKSDDKITNLWHDSIHNIDVIKSKESILNITKKIITNKLVTNKDSEVITLIDEIDALRKTGFITGSNQAWQNYYNNSYRQIISNNNGDKAEKRVILLLLFNYPHLINSNFITNQNASISQEIERGDLEELVEAGKKPPLEYINYLEKNIDIFQNSNIYWYELYITKLLSHTLSTNQSILNALALDPLILEYYTAFSVSCRYLSIHINKIKAILTRTLELNPTDAYAWSTLATTASYINESSNIGQLSLQALKYMPDDISLLSNLAGHYSGVGNHEKAIEIYKKCLLNKNIDNAHIFSNFLFSIIHTNTYTPEQIFELHKEYGELVTAWANEQKWHKTFYNDKSSDRPLRIGFVSGDLREHAVTKFLLPYWEGINKNKFHIYAYSSHSYHDETSDRLQKSATKWQNVISLSHLELAKQIHTDQIDILIDLSGHTAHNRLPVFALKPAPVQMTWIGYPATTGLEQIDYKFANDFYYQNQDFLWQFTEKLLCIKSVSSKFDNTINLPSRAKLIPVKRNNYFTFASFNRPQKIGNDVLKSWAKIMVSCPDDKLLLANMPDDETITTLKEKIISFGAKESQLIFKKRLNLYEYMELHNQVDLLLDTFPYAAGTTSVHAISMGVAAIYLKGKTMVSNPLIYNNYNLSDFGASNTKEYIEKAIFHSKDHAKLQYLRENLDLENSNSKGNPVELFEKSLEYVWENYCLGNPARSTIIN